MSQSTNLKQLPEKLSLQECGGIDCPHKTTEKHYIVFESELGKIINLISKDHEQLDPVLNMLQDSVNEYLEKKLQPFLLS